MRAYIDSDILIWHLRGGRKALNLLKNLRDGGEYELWTGAMQRAEILFFMRPDEEEATGLFMSQFRTASVDQTIVDIAGALYRKWNPTHGIDINNAFLAATAMNTGGRVFSLDTKHYPMEDVLVTKAW